MIEAKKFDDKFYDSQADGSYQSALVILPLINALIKPRSVLDVGCGVGTWLKVWSEKFNVQDIVGIDGDYVNREHLKIPQQNYLGKDLKQSFSLGRKFDLAMSVEVGEHLPESVSTILVDNLIQHSDVVVFSSANLEQRGTYHINEKPPEFWAKIFAERKYIAVDILRDRIWNDESVEWWYRQNILIYVNKDSIDKFPALAERAKFTSIDSLFRIHPKLWKYRNEENETRSHLGSFLKWKLSEIKKSIFK